MKKIIIPRIWEDKHSTYGAICYKRPFAVTIEPLWRDNKPDISCIPPGKYYCRRRYYNAGKYPTFQIMDVRGRDLVLFHKGNKTGRPARKIKSDTQGCVVIGESYDRLWTPQGFLWGILSSKHGFNEFMQILKGDVEFDLEIIDCIKRIKGIKGGPDVSIKDVWPGGISC